jgi:hypothetical protein
MSDKKKPAPFDFDEAVDATNYFVVEVTRAEVLFKEVLTVRTLLPTSKPSASNVPRLSSK